MKNTSIKPLFHEKTISRAMNGFVFPKDFEARREKIRPWIAILHSGVLDIVKEVSLHGEFLNCIFGKILGYSSVVEGGGKYWSIHAETTISHGGGSADGALGIFSSKEGTKGGVVLTGRIVAPIELKGATNILDRPAPGRNESAVDQGWRYANYSEDCRWVLVSNYREIRLYRTNKTPAFAECFLLNEMTSPEVFKRFYFLLCAENFLPAQDDVHGQTRIDLLLRDSDAAETVITKDLYEEYKLARFALVDNLRLKGPRDVDPGLFIERAQKLLDRILFIAFCEDRGLLPRDTLKKAHDHKDPYNPTAIWTRLKAVFTWVDKGRDDPPIPGYNGGLFGFDPLLDEKITIPDELCSQLVRLARFDYDTDVSVEVLGHIFEQSITDLEELKSNATGDEFNAKKGRRKTQGVYYTPAWVTRHIAKTALGGYLASKEEVLRERFSLAEIPQAHGRKLAKAEKRFWIAYRDEILKKTKVLDPACGSGAFLVAAFDYLYTEYERVNLALASLAEGKNVLKGQTSFEDLNKTILTNNLFGVDLSSESAEITKLSLWLKTAERNKALTFLDHNIKHGNSIVEDKSLDPDAFAWRKEFASVFADGGFDVVLGNPPYVRQELLSPFKPYLQEHYRAYDGVADLYTYFYERGVDVLKPGGALSFIVTNKWFKSGYGESLRAFFSEHTVFDQIIDFGHAPIFEDADVFPCIVSIRKPVMREEKKNAAVRVCPVPREALVDLNVEQYVAQNGYDVPWSRFGKDAWSLESPAVDALMEKIRCGGVPLSEYAGYSPLVGIKTGLNAAFLMKNDDKNMLIRKDPNSEVLLKPYLRGQDVKRWNAGWQKLWILLIASSSNKQWPWSAAGNEVDAERKLQKSYPAVHEFLKPNEESLRSRTDQGRFWWELRNCAYYDRFLRPKTIWQDLSFHSRFCVDALGIVPEMTCFFLSSADRWTIAVLNSPLMWTYLWRNTIHGKDEVLRLKTVYTSQLPIAQVPPVEAEKVNETVNRLMEIVKYNQDASSEVTDWLFAEMGIDKPGNALSDFPSLDNAAFTAEVRKRLPKKAGGLSPNLARLLFQCWRGKPIQWGR